MRRANQTDNLFRDFAPSGKRIKQARELSGLTQLELSERIGVSPGLIAQIEGAFKLASREVVQRIALHTKHFQSSFFYRDTWVEFSSESVLFRAMARTTRTQETEIRRYAEIMSEIASCLLRHIKPIPFALSSSSGSGKPAEAARKVRSILGIPPDYPVGHLVREIEKSGILVIALPVDFPNRDALSLWSDEMQMWVIALSAARPGDRVRLSVAHELGHIVLKHSGRLHAAEQQAYDFAAELLMPEIAMRRELTPPVTLSALAPLKVRWRVSIQALMKRGRDLGIIDESRYKYLYTQISVKGWRKIEPVEIPLEKPRLIRQLMERVFGNKYEDLANELGLRPAFVREMLSTYDESPDSEQPCTPKVVSLRRR